MAKQFKYFQPNDKDTKDKFGDCTIRALCKALDKTWAEVFDLLVPIMREEQNLLSGFTLEQYKRVYSSLGFTYHGISNAKGSKRPTVESFTKEHKSGTYILSIAHHHCAVVDGVLYDKNDYPNPRSMYGYWEKDNS